MPKKPARKRVTSSKSAGSRKAGTRCRAKSSRKPAPREVPSDDEDLLGIRGLLEEDDGLGQMFAQALLSAQGGDLTDAAAFADMLVEAIYASPKDELDGESPNDVFDRMAGSPKRKKPRRSDDEEEPLRRPRPEGRPRPPRL